MATRAPDYALEGESGDRERYLVLAHQAGDPFAFTEIVKDHYSSLYAHAIRRMGDQRAAEDVVQDALLRAYRGLDKFSGEYKLSAWLHRIVDNVCADEGSRRQREAKLAERWGMFADVSAPAADEYLADDHAAATVRSAVASLPDSYREALVLRDVMDMEYADVAEQIGITEQNARARVSRARAALRKMVAPTFPVWVFVVRAARRRSATATRIAAKLTTQFTSAAGQATTSVTQATAAAASAPPEVLAAPARLAPAIGTLAVTAVAAVASVGIPAFVSSSNPSPSAPASPPAANTKSVLAGPQPPSAKPGTPTALVVAAAAPTSNPTTTTSTTAAATTTVVSTAVTSIPLTGGSAGGAAALAALTSNAVQTDSGGGLTEGPGQLAVGPVPPSTGRLTTRLVLPTALQPCAGLLTVKFVWAASHSTTSFEVTVTAAIVSAAHRNGAVAYALHGPAHLVGGFGGLAGPLEAGGVIVVPDDGSNGQLDMSLTSSNGATSVGCTVDAAAIPVPTTLPAPSTTVVAPTTTVAAA